jgi:hypothetical protein
MLTLTPSRTLSDHPIFSLTCPLDHLMISQYRRKSADTNYSTGMSVEKVSEEALGGFRIILEDEKFV